jgi:hypothetical protein
MFCPNCGKADQTKNTYCRNCGGFLPDLKNIGKKRTTPEDQFKLTLMFNRMSAIGALSMAIMLYIFHLGNENTHPSVYFAAAFLLVIAAWQIVSYFNNRKLKELFIREKEIDDTEIKAFEMPKTNRSLNEVNLSDNIPASVVENTTRKLKVENKKASE